MPHLRAIPPKAKILFSFLRFCALARIRRPWVGVRDDVRYKDLRPKIRGCTNLLAIFDFRRVAPSERGGTAPRRTGLILAIFGGRWF